MKKKQMAAVAISALIAAALPGMAYGSPAGTTEEETIRAAALRDNKMEYGELGDLIANYNVTYKNAHSQIVNATKDLETVKDLKEEAGNLMEDAAELKSDGLNEMTKELYDSYRETARELRKQAGQISGAELSSSYQRTLRKSKAQLTVMAQQMMIGYHEALSNRELMNKRVELAQAALESSKRQAQLGMKSLEEVQVSEQTLKQAENGAAQFSAQLQSLKQNLQLVTGWEHDAEAEIGPIPASDIGAIAAMNPQNDLQTAIGTNYDLYDVRSVKAKGASARGVKNRNVIQSEENLASALQTLYASVLSKQQAYEGAQAAYDAAEQNKQMANRKQSMGMMGRLEYLSAEADYLAAKAAKETADMELFSAMETYNWALKGLVISNGGGN
ncbi:MAG: TolC family protein [Clostridium sp.]